MELTKEILNTTLASFDHLNLIIIDSDLEDEKNKENHVVLIHKIHGLIQGSTVSQAVVVPSEIAENTNTTVIPDNVLRTYYVHFEPKTEFFLDGSNPLILVAELCQLGKYLVVPHFHKVTSIDDFNPTSCITFWEIYIESGGAKDKIDEVFVFAESNAKIEVVELTSSDLISNKEFAEKVQELKFKDQLINRDVLFELSARLGKSIVPDLPILPAIDANELLAESKNTQKSETKEKVVSSIRVSSDKLDELMNLVSELVTTQASLTLYNQKNETPELELISENIEKLSRRLRDIAFGMTLVPINNMFSRFQRLVRDVSMALNKEVQFVTEGGETELDKSIIETLTDPLMHIIRNSLDHGLELPDVRERLGKTRKGTVKLKAFYSGISVYIQIIDDGKGIDVNVIREKAVSKGFIKSDDVLTDKEVFDFIFYPGFSTAAVVTDISGRGVGMDVVKRNISELKGSIVVESQVNIGTTLTIKLPLSLSIIDGLLVDVANVYYIIPLSVVDKCYEVDNFEMMNNFNQLLVLDEKQVPFINVRREFGYEEMSNSEKSQIIVVSDADRRVGISVDHIVGGGDHPNFLAHRHHQRVVHFEQVVVAFGLARIGHGTLARVQGRDVA